MLTKQVFKDNHLCDELAISLEEVAVQTKSLCDYLSELRDIKKLPTELSKDDIIKSINRVARRILIMPASRPIACGTTQNNIDQFYWLDLQLARHSPGLKMANVSLAPWSQLRCQVDIDAKLLSNLTEIVHNAIKNMQSNLYHSNFLFKYSLNFLHFYISFYFLSLKKCPFVCVANDHTPVNMGFSKAARSHGLYRIYLQHAFVTELFPKLDFELSLLFNRASVEKYSAERELGKSVLVLPRYPAEAALEEDLLFKKEMRSQEKNIVIYLGGSNDFCFLRKAIVFLQCNKFTNSIVVKLHPNPINHSIASYVIKEFGEDSVVFNDQTHPHIAICGNSSVVMKLLSKGVRCYSLFDLDSRRRDYYGFAASGAAKELNLSRLHDDFWSDWDEATYLRARIKYIQDPTSNESLDSIIQLDVILRERLNNNSNLVYLRKRNFDGSCQKISSAIDHDLELTPAEFSYLNSLTVCKVVSRFNKLTESDLDLSPKIRMQLLNRFYQFRHPNAINLMIIAADYDPSVYVRIYFKYRAAHLIGLKLVAGVSEDIKCLYSLGTDTVKPEYVLSSVLIYLAAYPRNVTPTLLELFLETPINVAALSAKAMHSICLIIDLPQFKETTFARKARHIPQLSGFLDAMALRQVFPDNNISHADLVFNYFSEIPSCSGKESTLRQFAKIESWISDRSIKDLRLARLNDYLHDQFWDLVKSALACKRGYSFIRLSDGEGFIYSDSIFSLNDCKNRERHWWGFELHETQRLILQRELVLAVRNSDVIGLPSIFRIIRDLPPSVFINSTVLDSVQRRGIFEVIAGFLRYGGVPDAIVEERANDYLFSDLFERLRSLSKFIDKIVLVSSLPENVVGSLFGDFNDFVELKIPTRVRNSKQPGRSISGDPLLPSVYKTIACDVQQHARPGVVFLVSGGVIGKLFIDIAKRHGAIGLDLGEVVESL